MHLPFAVTSVAQAAAVASLAADAELLARTDGVVAERTRVRDALIAGGYDVPPTSANFLWLPLGDQAAAFGEAGVSAKVLTRPFAGTGCASPSAIPTRTTPSWRSPSGPGCPSGRPPSRAEDSIPPTTAPTRGPGRSRLLLAEAEGFELCGTLQVRTEDALSPGISGDAGYRRMARNCGHVCPKCAHGSGAGKLVLNLERHDPVDTTAANPGELMPDDPRTADLCSEVRIGRLQAGGIQAQRMRPVCIREQVIRRDPEDDSICHGEFISAHSVIQPRGLVLHYPSGSDGNPAVVAPEAATPRRSPCGRRRIARWLPSLRRGHALAQRPGRRGSSDTRDHRLDDDRFRFIRLGCTAENARHPGPEAPPPSAAAHLRPGPGHRRGASGCRVHTRFSARTRSRGCCFLRRGLRCQGHTGQSS
ncbi:aminotransferase domain protein [Rhodococcus sp. MTM3W5.2]|nr:aminotransferase domain protein [Rhodococcus sp. MTM3W5.2]